MLADPVVMAVPIVLERARIREERASPRRSPTGIVSTGVEGVNLCARHQLHALLACNVLDILREATVSTLRTDANGGGAAKLLVLDSFSIYLPCFALAREDINS